MHGSWQRRRFSQHLPEWIERDDGFRKLPAAAAAVLRAIANRCSLPDEAGNLLGAYPRRDTLMSAANIKAPSTYWLAISKLIGGGYLKLLTRGGAIGCANSYGIPGSRGSLGHVHTNRRMTANGRGGDKPRRYIMAMSPAPIINEETPPEIGREPVPKSDANPSENRTLSVPVSSPKSTTAKRTPKPAPKPAPQKAVVVEDVHQAEPDDELAVALDEAGIVGGTRRRLAAAGVTAAMVRSGLHRLKNGTPKNNPAGYLVKVLLEEATKAVKAAAVKAKADEVKAKADEEKSRRMAQERAEAAELASSIQAKRDTVAGLSRDQVEHYRSRYLATLEPRQREIAGKLNPMQAVSLVTAIVAMHAEEMAEART